jgi:hypothetical protein
MDFAMCGYFKPSILTTTIKKFIEENFKTIRHLKLNRFLLPPMGIACSLAIMIVVPLNYSPDITVPFPYIPPPLNGYYLGMTVEDASNLLTAGYSQTLPVGVGGITGESIIFKNILLTAEKLQTKRVEVYAHGKELVSTEVQTYIMASSVQFFPRDPSALEKLRVGDVVDIIGVCAGMSEEWPSVIVIRDCQILPAGLAPLPLPGGPAFVGGGY